MTQPCINPGVVCPPDNGENDFLGNFSSEAPDEILFYYKRYATYQPPLGSPWTSTTASGECHATTAQEAEICARNKEKDKEAENTPEIVPNPAYDPEDPDRYPPTIERPRILYWNEEQTCSYPCGDGTFQTVTIAAHTYKDFSVAAANAYAYGQACAQAKLNLICIGELSVSRGCLGQTMVATVSISTRFPPASFGLAPAQFLPPGMVLVSIPPNTMQIVGVPTSAGTFSFTVVATDSHGNSVSKTLTIGIVSIANASALPNATANAAYSQTLTAAGPANAPITWSITAGALPAGMTLNATTGIISGTPTVAGSYSFTVSMDFS